MEENEEMLRQREALLAEKEEQLKQKEEEVKKLQEAVYKNAKERLYDKIHVPLWVLDAIIGCGLIIIVLIFLFKSNF